MVISYQGGECFKVAFGETTLAFNPISKDSALKGSRFGADMALITTHHPDMNGVEQVRGTKELFVVDGPGEYEAQGVVVKGFLSQTTYGGARHNTIYHVVLDGMDVVFLGALGERELPQEARQAIDTVDILFVPIGGDGVLGPADAHKVAVELEPHAVIPMHYNTNAGALGEKGALELFLKEAGGERVKPQEKLTIKRKDIADLSGEVMVLAA